MPTQLEIKIVHILYSSLSCNFLVVPLFNWNDMKLSVRLNGRLIRNWVLNCVIVLEFFSSAKQLSKLIKERDINVATLQFIYIVRLYSHFIFRLNMLYKTEVAHLINQTIYTNKGWGNKTESLIVRLWLWYDLSQWSQRTCSAHSLYCTFRLYHRRQ